MSEGGIGDLEFDSVGADDEPEQENGEADDDDDGEEEIEDAGAETEVDAAAWSMVGGGRRDGWAIVGPVQLGVFSSHVQRHTRVEKGYNNGSKRHQRRDHKKAREKRPPAAAAI